MSNDSKDELTLRIGEKLTAARIESGYTQSRAARAVGTSQSCISTLPKVWKNFLRRCLHSSIIR